MFELEVEMYFGEEKIKEIKDRALLTGEVVIDTEVNGEEAVIVYKDIKRVPGSLNKH